MFVPLVPSRFSAPQFIAEPGSPADAFAAPYVMVSCSLAGPWWFSRDARIQISPCASSRSEVLDLLPVDDDPVAVSVAETLTWIALLPGGRPSC